MLRFKTSMKHLLMTGFTTLRFLSVEQTCLNSHLDIYDSNLFQTGAYWKEGFVLDLKVFKIFTVYLKVSAFSKF